MPTHITRSTLDRLREQRDELDIAVRVLERFQKQNQTMGRPKGSRNKLNAAMDLFTANTPPKATKEKTNGETAPDKWPAPNPHGPLAGKELTEAIRLVLEANKEPADFPRVMTLLREGGNTNNPRGVSVVLRSLAKKHLHGIRRRGNSFYFNGGEEKNAR